MKTKEGIEQINVKLFLYITRLKEAKKLTLEETPDDERLVFIFKNKESLYSFLIDKDIDVSSPKIKDIVDRDIIMKIFANGTVICPKVLCQYLYKECQETKESLKVKEYQKRIKTKLDAVRAQTRTTSTNN